MKELLIVAASLINIAGTLPYMVDIWRGKTKPRLVSWFIWAALTGIAATASWSDGHVAAASLASIMTLNCFAVALLGWIKCKTASFEKLDMLCLALALTAPTLWYSFHSSGLAVFVVIIVDVIAGIPTMYHAWRAPQEETLGEYIWLALRALLSWLPQAILR